MNKYKIDLCTLSESINAIKAQYVHVLDKQNRLLIVGTMLLNTAWTGEAAEGFATRSELLNTRISSHLQRAEKGYDLLDELYADASAADLKAYALAGIWSGYGGGDSLVANHGFYAGQDNAIVSIDRDVCAQVQESSRAVINSYFRQENYLVQLVTLYNQCNFVFPVGSQLTKLKSVVSDANGKIGLFPGALIKYENAIDAMEREAQRSANEIGETEIFEDQPIERQTKSSAIYSGGGHSR